ncbi:MAG: hypothetical protein CVV64_08100 [Candidatus Wallbacteria bacterium HGW-Wallbacteria-1]|jgi:hypothetical protein|uniref:Queuosine 5'-phosphate N-glycosylase/hydrolase n=1 Tax=Candidatus Wallbacteria bacterium HGW-Wallbacteria-1 TaxID=2013854 RepID=A0A2N1PRD4_9BACT|nr:MAG: hypothetical protein CVV64_08100 [Candidatus Wallbacteria bacterium HGW-Wallbacteria-1]
MTSTEYPLMEDLRQISIDISSRGVRNTIRERACSLTSNNTVQKQYCSMNDSVLNDIVTAVSKKTPTIPAWNRKDNSAFPHSMQQSEAIAFFTVLNSINFCFWTMPDQIKWHLNTDNGKVDGAMALFHGMCRGWYNQTWERFLQSLCHEPEQTMNEYFRGHGHLLLWNERVAMISDAAEYCLKSINEFSSKEFIDQTAGEFIAGLIQKLPGFRDPFLKRAQLAWAMIHGHLGSPPVKLKDLTLFADYKVPQTLHNMGILKYNTELTSRLENHENMSAGSQQELQIRAWTIICGERLVTELNRCRKSTSRNWNGASLDYYLWSEGQKVSAGSLPYHRCVTCDY